jgi:hypothetical protein
MSGIKAAKPLLWHETFDPHSEHRVIMAMFGLGYYRLGFDQPHCVSDSDVAALSLPIRMAQEDIDAVAGCFKRPLVPMNLITMELLRIYVNAQDEERITCPA